MVIRLSKSWKKRLVRGFVDDLMYKSDAKVQLKISPGTIAVTLKKFL